MDNELKKENLIFTDNTQPGEKAILGTLEGPCADIIANTRNGRHYSEKLWDTVFKDPIVNELIENGGIPGELDHPANRQETDSSRIAILMREKPLKKNGKLWAKFDILNTPLGKIAYTLAKAGFKLGVSSRGEGDVIDNYDGSQEVDESTYDFKCFDLVLLPAVKAARLNLITEGLNQGFNYKKALKESLETATEEDRKLMKETLDNLKVVVDEEIEELEDADKINNGFKVSDILKSLKGNALDLELYESSNGSCYVEEYIKSICSENKKLAGKLLHSLSVFKQLGIATREPYTKSVTDDGIYEVRAKENSNISRVLFFFVIGNRAIITNGFTKKTEKTPQSEIDKAIELRKDYYRNGGK